MLIEYARQFWDWKLSPYIKRKNQYAPDSITKAYADYNLHYINIHASRFFMQRNLAEIRPIDIENYLYHLRDTLTTLKNTTINKIVAAIVKPLNEAYRLGLIDTNPIRGSYRLPTVPFTKGVFTQEEIAKIANVDWKNSMVLNAFKLAAMGGLRLGEIRAVRLEDLGDNYISITIPSQRRQGLSAPKIDELDQSLFLFLWQLTFGNKP